MARADRGKGGPVEHGRAIYLLRARRWSPRDAVGVVRGGVAAPAAPRSPGEIINDIQRELARRGYYDGAVEGLYGPKTDAAIRDFEQVAGLKPSTEPNDALLQAIVRSPAKAVKGTTGATASARP